MFWNTTQIKESSSKVLATFLQSTINLASPLVR